MELIKQALENGRTTLAEFDSKQILAEYGIPVTQEREVRDLGELQDAMEQIGFPLVLKGNSSEITHKTEAGLIYIDLRTQDETEAAFTAIMETLGPENGSVLVQEMIKGDRELVVGMLCDPQFGPCVMFGQGGIFTEIFRDVVFRVAPLTRKDAMEMMDDIRAAGMLNAVRGMAAVDREKLADILMAVGKIGLDYTEIQEIDINPIKIRKGLPVAVDALVVLKEQGKDIQ